MIKKSILLVFGIIILCILFTNCNNAAPDAITVLQIHLEDSLSIQAGIYDSVRIDLTDKDHKIYKEKIFIGPYDKLKDKVILENIELPSDAPKPVRVVISAYKGKIKQAEFVIQVSTENIAKVEPTTFIPPLVPKDSIISTPIDTTKPKDTTSIPSHGHVILSSHEIELFEGGDSAIVAVKLPSSDSGKTVVISSTNEEVFMVTTGNRLFPRKAGQAFLIAFVLGFPATGDTARVTVVKDPPVIEVGSDRKVSLDSLVSFPIHIIQRHGTVKSLKWDLDGDGKFEDSASKSDTSLFHTYKTKGEFTVKFYARDSEGNETIKTLRIQAGILAPFVVITKPSADTTVNSTPFLVEYLADGVMKIKSAMLSEGKNIVTISETNPFGVGTDTVIINLDTRAPGAPVFSIQTPAYSKSRKPTWNWTQNLADKGNGIFKITLDGTKDTVITTSKSFTPTIDLSDGSHFLSISERDDAGNWSTAVSQTVYVDLIKPLIAIESPSSQLFFTTGENAVVVSGSASDIGGIVAVTYSVGSKTTSALGTDKWKTGSISIIDNTTTMVVVSVEDKAGNTAADTIRILSDKRGPGVTIIQPNAVISFFTTTGTISIKGSASDSSAIKYVKYTLDGATIGQGDAIGTTNWQIPSLNVLSGATQLTVTAYDSLLNPGSLILDIIYKPNIYLVDAGAKGKNTGTNWADAFTDLQSALAINIVGEVWVAKGIYKPTSGINRNISFVTQAGVHLYGGFKGNETARQQRDLANNNSILSGDIGASVATDNSYHVVRGASPSTIDGFTITAGYAEVAGTENAKGAGIYSNGFSPNILNTVVRNNFAIGDGGGIYFVNSISQVINCIFADNEAMNSGGAISMTGNSSPVVLQSLFIRNKTTNVGGAIVIGETSNLTLKNSLFSVNEAAYGKNIGLNGSLILQYTNADSTWNGGVMKIGVAASENFWTKNSYQVPIFVGPSDYHLKPGSPGIDEGMDGPEIPKFDITGEIRPKGNGIDLGPYEQ